MYVIYLVEIHVSRWSGYLHVLQFLLRTVLGVDWLDLIVVLGKVDDKKWRFQTATATRCCMVGR